MLTKNSSQKICREKIRHKKIRHIKIRHKNSSHTKYIVTTILAQMHDKQNFKKTPTNLGS